MNRPVPDVAAPTTKGVFVGGIAPAPAARS
jgi:hypothetical protein